MSMTWVRNSTASRFGRNSFQRPKREAVEFLSQVMDIYAGKTK